MHWLETETQNIRRQLPELIFIICCQVVTPLGAFCRGALNRL